MWNMISRRGEGEHSRKDTRRDEHPLRLEGWPAGPGEGVSSTYTSQGSYVTVIANQSTKFDPTVMNPNQAHGAQHAAPLKWRNSMRVAALLTLLALTGAPIWGQETPNAPAQATRQPEIRALSEEVLLDVIVRDKHGRPVRDLKPEEVEVFEEGIQQKITSFRLLEGEDILTPEAGGASKPAATKLDPLWQVHLVTLLFERLGDDGRRLSRQAALELLKNELRQNFYVAVFTIDQRLSVLQPFSNDRALLRQAVERATSGTYSEFASLSDKIQHQLEVATASQTVAEQAGAALEAGRGSLGKVVTAFVNATADRITLNILQYSEALAREQQGRSSIFSLLSLVTQQRGLPGRKTVVYFSEGLHVPSSLEEHFRAAISGANRSNVSVYAVDARGLMSRAQMDTTRQMLADAARASQTQMKSGGRLVRPEEAKLFETAQDSIRANLQGALTTLAESTGGFLIANTNDLRLPMQRITEDIETYYELAYVPWSGEYDGRFRKISVKVLRPEVKVQARSGYFALPPTEGSPLFPYEMPMLSALSTNPLPRAFDFHAAAFRFGQEPNGVQYALVMEAPLKSFAFTLDKGKRVYWARFSLLALFKNSEGRVVERFSQDQPLEVPADKLEAVQKGNFILTRHLRLAPGRYTLETAAVDRQTLKTSARRAVLVVSPARQGIAISSVSLIRRIDAQDAAEHDAEDPLRFHGGRIVPSLSDAIQSGPGTALSLYFVIYPSVMLPGKPQLSLEFFRDGELVARAAPELPAPDENGRISYVASSSAENFKPGQYEVRTIVQQGASAAQEHAFFTINP